MKVLREREAHEKDYDRELRKFQSENRLRMRAAEGLKWRTRKYEERG